MLVNNNLSFKGCKALTKGVEIDFYTGRYVEPRKRTTEHIIPKSKGGRNDIRNYAMVETSINTERGNKPLLYWLKEHPDYLENMKTYVLIYWNKLINGVRHGEEVAKTVKKIIGIDIEPQT